MKIARLMAAGVLALVVSAPAGAVTLYSNNFDTENGGAGATALDYAGFTGLTVSGGSVDLVQTPYAGIACAGGGRGPASN